MTNKYENLLKAFMIFDSADLLLVFLGTDGKIRFMNKKACEFFGVEREETIGKDFFADLNVCEAGKLSETFRAGLKRKEPFIHEIRILTKENRVQRSAFEFMVLGEGDEGGVVGIGGLAGSTAEVYIQLLDLLLREWASSIRESEARYRELVELAKSIIFKWDAEGKVVWMNEYGLRFFGFSEDEVVGRSVYETFVPRVESTGRDLSTLVRDIIENEERFASNINENVKKDGTRVWVHWSNMPIKDEKGKLLAIISIGTDITDRVKMERLQEYELKKNRALTRLYSLLTSQTTKIDDIEEAILEEAMAITESRDGLIGRLDPLTKELVIKKTIQEHLCEMKEKKVKLLGYGAEPKSLIEFALTNLRAYYTNSPSEHPAYKGPPDWHIKIDRLLVVPTIFHDQAVGVIALANSKRDYNEQDLVAVEEMCKYFVLALQRMRYEEELAIKENLYRTLFENAPVPTLSVDENGVISNINAAFERLSGYTKAEVEGKKSWREFVHPDDIKRMESYRAERLDGRHAPPSYEFRFLDKQTNIHEVLINVALIPGTRKIIASFVDLTDIKRLQEDLRRSKEALERYSKHLEELIEERTKELREKERLATIGQTAASIAHDLKSPLQVLINSVYIAKMGISKLPPQLVEQLSTSGVMESLSKIERQIGYINRILSDLQEVSRPIKPEIRGVGLGPLIHETLQSVNIPSNVEVDVREQGGVARLDPYLMKRVLVNLIENAIHAMPQGGKLSIETSRTDSDVLITIKDTGTGMPKDVLDNIFKPFFTTKAKGTGFGLYTSKRIVDAHGGSISVESEVGKGTTFTIRIPMRE